MILHWPYPHFRHYQKEMRECATRWFLKRGYPVQRKYPFILQSRDDWRSNIILTEVTDYIEQVRDERTRRKESFPLHQYIHHGLSSQAMLFNLVGPLVVRDDLNAMCEAFIAAGSEWPRGPVTAYLELEDRDVFNEHQAQPTSIDLAIGSEGGSYSIFVEAKLVEQEFGGCSVFRGGDCDGRSPAQDHENCYLHHIGRRYWSCLDERGFLKGQMGAGPLCMLASYYQYFREVLFALEKGGDLAFLIDERSPVFVAQGRDRIRGLIPFLEGFLPRGIQERVHTVTIQDVVTAIGRSGRHGDWIAEFKEKYGIGDPAPGSAARRC